MLEVVLSEEGIRCFTKSVDVVFPRPVLFPRRHSFSRLLQRPKNLHLFVKHILVDVLLAVVLVGNLVMPCS